MTIMSPGTHRIKHTMDTKGLHLGQLSSNKETKPFGSDVVS